MLAVDMKVSYAFSNQGRLESWSSSTARDFRDGITNFNIDGGTGQLHFRISTIIIQLVGRKDIKLTWSNSVNLMGNAGAILSELRKRRFQSRNALSESREVRKKYNILLKSVMS